MAEEIGALRAVLALESAAFDRGVQSARRQLTVLEGGLNKTGGQVAQFGQRMSRDATAGFRSIERSSGAARAGLQNFGFQVQDVAVQIAAGTSASRALAVQLPQLLSGFGLLGVGIGTVVAVLGPMVARMFDAAAATQSWVDELSLTSGSVGSVESAVSALEAVQRQYNDAITAQGGASSASAALVIANSAKEFEARKALLGVEIELLRIRGIEQQQRAQNLSDAIRLQAEATATPRVDLRQLGMGGTDRAGNTLDSYVNVGPRNLNEMGLGDGFAQATQRDQLALRKLNAEMTLTNQTIAKTEELMNSTFGTIAGGGATGGAGSGGGGGGGGGGRRTKAAEAVAEVATETQKLSQSAQQLQSSFGTAFVDMITGAKSAQDAISGLLSDLAKTLANSAFQQISGLIFPSLLPSANGNVFSGGRVQAFARGGVVNSPTIFPMANGTGLMGEAGPEAIMPLTRIGGKLGVRAAGGGGTTISIDARGAVEGTAAQIERALQRVLPGVVQQSVAATRAAASRGR